MPACRAAAGRRARVLSGQLGIFHARWWDSPRQPSGRAAFDATVAV